MVNDKFELSQKKNRCTFTSGRGEIHGSPLCSSMYYHNMVVWVVWDIGRRWDGRCHTGRVEWWSLERLYASFAWCGQSALPSRYFSLSQC